MIQTIQMTRVIKITRVIKMTLESRRWRGCKCMTRAADRLGSALSATHPFAIAKRRL